MKSICSVLILFFFGKFLPTGGSAVLIQSYLLGSAAPVGLLNASDLNSLYEADKPDVELGNQLEQFANDIKPLIPSSRTLTSALTGVANWGDNFYPRLIDAGLKLQVGTANSALKASISEEVKSVIETSSALIDEIKKMVRDGQSIIEMAEKISKTVIEKKNNAD